MNDITHPDGAQLRRSCRRAERSGHRHTHAIVHRCFPPMPARCLLCGREGADLDAQPCFGHAEPGPVAGPVGTRLDRSSLRISDEQARILHAAHQGLVQRDPGSQRWFIATGRARPDRRERERLVKRGMLCYAELSRAQDRRTLREQAHRDRSRDGRTACIPGGRCGLRGVRRPEGLALHRTPDALGMRLWPRRAACPRHLLVLRRRLGHVRLQAADVRRAASSPR